MPLHAHFKLSRAIGKKVYKGPREAKIGKERLSERSQEIQGIQSVFASITRVLMPTLNPQLCAFLVEGPEKISAPPRTKQYAQQYARICVHVRNISCEQGTADILKTLGRQKGDE